VHVFAIGDHARPALIEVRGGTDCARLTTAEGRHGIEHMRESTKPLLPRSLELDIRRQRVSGRHDDAAPHKFTNRTGRHLLRCQRDECATEPCRAKQLKRSIIQRLNLCSGVYAPLGDVDKGPFDMTTEHSRDTRLDRSVRGTNRFGHDLTFIADHRRQQAGRTQASVCRSDAAYALEIWQVIEQHSTAAIDLQVNEAGYEIALDLPYRNAVWPSRVGADIDHAPVFDEHVPSRHEPLGQQHPIGSQRHDAHALHSTPELRSYGRRLPMHLQNRNAGCIVRPSRCSVSAGASCG